MKKLLLSLTICTSIILVGQAQINTNPPPTGFNDFTHTVFGYFSEFNTNLAATFEANPFDIWTGASSIQGGPHPLVNDLSASYDLWHMSASSTNSPTWTALDVEVVTRNEGVAGSLVSIQGGLGFNVGIYDTKITFYGNGGEYIDALVASNKRLYGEVGVRIKKALGTHFYAGVGAFVQFPENHSGFSALAGATF